MQTSILKYLEESTDKYPDKIAVIDERDSLSYRELLYDCKCIGSGLAVTISDHAPVGIYMEKVQMHCVPFWEQYMREGVTRF